MELESLLLILGAAIVIALLGGNNRNGYDHFYPPRFPYRRPMRPPVLYDYHDHPYYRYPDNSMEPYYLPYDADEYVPHPPNWGSTLAWIIILIMLGLYLFSRPV